MNTIRLIQLMAVILGILAGAAIAGYKSNGVNAGDDPGNQITEGSQAISMMSLSGSTVQINWQVLSSGGDIGGASTNFILSVTVAQSAVGFGTSDNYDLNHGF